MIGNPPYIQLSMARLLRWLGGGYLKSPTYSTSLGGLRAFGLFIERAAGHSNLAQGGLRSTITVTNSAPDPRSTTERFVSRFGLQDLSLTLVRGPVFARRRRRNRSSSWSRWLHAMTTNVRIVDYGVPTLERSRVGPSQYPLLRNGVKAFIVTNHRILELALSRRSTKEGVRLARC